MDQQPLHIQLLGTFQLRAGTVPVKTLHAPRLQALLAFLSLHRDVPQPRRHIAYSLWPASTEVQALTNLRNLVHQLRHLLPQADVYLASDGPTLQWRTDLPFHLDVAEFERALIRGGRLAEQGLPVESRAALEAAIAMYAGDLLPSCYDEWILPERERLRQRFLTALEQLVALLEAQRDYAAALPYMQRLAQAEPLHEAAYLQLMRLHALMGNRAAALQTYQMCAATLRRELAVEPAQPLRDAAARLFEQPSLAENVEGERGGLVLVGRQAEWRKLLETWQLAGTGHPQLLVLSGEAGIGKTRLAEELWHWAAQQGYVTARAQCYATESTLVYAPVSALLRAPALTRALGTLEACWLREIAHLLPELRSTSPELPTPGALDDPGQRQRLLEALRQTLLAAGQSLLLLIDNLQWCDRASLEALHYLLHEDATARLLIIATMRPDELDADSPLVTMLMHLRAKDQATVIELPPLGAAETMELAAQVAGRTLSDEEGAAVYAATEGNPLFTVEMLRAGYVGQRAHVYAGAGDVWVTAARPLPARVRALIDCRLARLSPLARDLAGVAAVIGRAITFPALALGCRGHDEDALLRGCDELLQRRILRECSDSSYDFSHAYLREAVYYQLSGARRQVLHCRVAAAPKMGLSRGQGERVLQPAALFHPGRGTR